MDRVLQVLDYLVEQCEEKANKKFYVRQNISDSAEVSNKNDVNWEQGVLYDVEYVKKFSIFLDIKIILKAFVSLFNKVGTEAIPE